MKPHSPLIREIFPRFLINTGKMTPKTDSSGNRDGDLNGELRYLKTTALNE